ncbi:LytTR family transcriptional regulator DNA-binding domain-containing protein [Peribacillus butanolivorans]|uniref:LytTR family DNA-binding domain-containing protein n=1 Tax=Peribacillus butanolivorans TaxID=421767 RepID=UPI00207C5D6F|nr:LytTR family DNA-binding domain-containing protein [Peribacillus butanolivorans]MCO0601265.1 LytTR family transcriptional regulator DNA-binding domain-containing protein [Peribacillus butanolivorans]
MKLFLNIDKAFKETRVTIEGPELDENIQELIDCIYGREQQFLIGKKGEMQHILKPDDIHYFHTENDHIIAVTETDSFILKEKLYELESMLPSKKFIRLSKSVIANLNQLSRFEALFNGTLCVYFKSGKKEYVTRTYVPAIKEALKLNRRKVE